MWERFLKVWDGVSQFIANAADLKLDYVACPTGYGVYCDEQWFNGMWWNGNVEKYLAYKEMLPLVVAAYLPISMATTGM